jgi:hypothetical protein
MVSWSTSLFHGLIICVPFSLFALITFHWRPRLWLHSLPADIQQRVPPKTRSEKRLTRYLLLPLLLMILPGLSVGSVWFLGSVRRIDFSFVGILTHLYVVWIVVHLWDFLIIDCISAFLIDPERPPISGTERSKGWKDYSFHFRAFVKATVMSALFVVPCAWLLTMILANP